MGKRKEKIKKRIKKTKEEIKKEILFNVPNTITLLRLILIFVFIYLLFSGFSKIVLIVVFSIAALTDWFDGYFARRLNQKTRIGARMDQVIDRVFTGMIVISLLIYMAMNNILRENIVLLFLVSSREIIAFPGLLIAIIRGKDVYSLKYIGKINTFIQSVSLGAIIFEFSWAIYPALATCIIGIISGFDYLKYSIS